MSAILIFSPWNQNVSPSTTQLIRGPFLQIENEPEAPFGCLAKSVGVGFRHPANTDIMVMTDRILKCIFSQFSLCPTVLPGTAVSLVVL